jgi:hypothetical protein
MMAHAMTADQVAARIAKTRAMFEGMPQWWNKADGKIARRGTNESKLRVDLITRKLGMVYMGLTGCQCLTQAESEVFYRVMSPLAGDMGKSLCGWMSRDYALEALARVVDTYGTAGE